MKIEQLAPYLPYKLQIQGQTHKDIETLSGIKGETVFIESSKSQYAWADVWEIKPLLLPLSQIEEYFKPLFETDNEVKTFLSEEFLKNYRIEICEIEFIEPDYLPYGTIKLLIKHHFDVFGLIDRGFATDLNTIKQ